MPKEVILTGGSRGIGAAIVQNLIKNKHKVAYCYKTQDMNIQELGFTDTEVNAIHSLKCDISIENNAKHFIDWCFNELNHPNGLVLNAGINIDKPFLELTQDNWKSVMDTNINACFVMIQEFLRRIGKNKANIITIGAYTAITGRKNGANYCASKAALMSLTRCIAHEFAPQVKANCIIPGYIATEEMSKLNNLQDETNLQKLLNTIPDARFGLPEEFAKVVDFLLTVDSYINGQQIFVNGGHYMP